MEDREHKITKKPLPQILDEIDERAEHLEDMEAESRRLIRDLQGLVDELRDALKKSEMATVEAKKAAAEAREAGVKAAAEALKAAAEAREAGVKAGDLAARTAREAIVEVRKIAEDALDGVNLIGTSLMTAADGMGNICQELLARLGERWEFKEKKR